MQTNCPVIIPPMPIAPAAERLAYGLADAAKTCGLSRRTLEREISAGRLKAGKIGSRVVIRRAALEQFLCDCEGK